MCWSPVQSGITTKLHLEKGFMSSVLREGRGRRETRGVLAGALIQDKAARSALNILSQQANPKRPVTHFRTVAAGRSGHSKKHPRGPRGAQAGSDLLKPSRRFLREMPCPADLHPEPPVRSDGTSP